MDLELEEAMHKLNSFKNYKVLYGKTFVMDIELLENIQESIKIVLDELEDFKEGNIVSLKLLENFYLVSKNKEKQMTLANKELFDNYIPKKKIEDKVKEQIKEADEILKKEEYIDNFNGSKENQKYYFDGYKDASLFIRELLEEK